MLGVKTLARVGSRRAQGENKGPQFAVCFAPFFFAYFLFSLKRKKVRGNWQARRTNKNREAILRFFWVQTRKNPATM